MWKLIIIGNHRAILSIFIEKANFSEMVKRNTYFGICLTGLSPAATDFALGLETHDLHTRSQESRAGRDLMWSSTPAPYSSQDHT